MMGDHFVLLVDRLLTESTLDAAIESRKLPHIGRVSASESAATATARVGFCSQKGGFSESSSSPQKLVECRICHDEDADSNMEAPCSCCGSLKYAHRKCVQRWCNEKGDTVCEICLQEFKPGYTTSSQLFQYGGIPMNFRGNWEITRSDLSNSRYLAMVAHERDFNYDDFSSSNTRSKIYCRAVALIFTGLLLLRHTLPIMLSGAPQYSFALFLSLLLRIVGVLLPLYIMTRALIAFQHRRQNQILRRAF